MNEERVGHVCPVLTPAQILRGLQSGRYVMTPLGLERRCSLCGEYWPADTEFFYYQPSSSAGLCTYCHDCYRTITERQPGQRRKADQAA